MVQTKKIRILAIELGTTFAQIATDLEIRASMASRLIHGRRPLYPYRQPLADLLDVDLQTIFPDVLNYITGRPAVQFVYLAVFLEMGSILRCANGYDHPTDPVAPYRGLKTHGHKV